MEPMSWRVTVAIGFFLSQALLTFFFWQTQQDTRKIETIRLARELSSSFYFDDQLYKNVRNSIEACQKLYKSNGGPYGHDDINKYLGFFEDLGYYQKREFLDNEIVAHFYGAYIIEAFEYPELKDYVARLRKNARQPDAFIEFERLAVEMKKDPQFAELVKVLPISCQPAATAAQRP